MSISRIKPEHRLGLIVLGLLLTMATVAMVQFSPKPVATTKPVASATPDSDGGTDDGPSTAHDNSPAALAPTTSNAGCDASLWSHIYHPSRLHIIDNCKTVTGVIEVIRLEPDGDDHILLKLDAPFAGLINAKNTQIQHADLVLEPVCMHTVTQSDATAACQGYHSNLTIPPVGTHVTVTGSYVLDADHGWNEIHPITSIQN